VKPPRTRDRILEFLADGRVATGAEIGFAVSEVAASDAVNQQLSKLAAAGLVRKSGGRGRALWQIVKAA
jgi:predicted ArsR family transcriptional regulator